MQQQHAETAAAEADSTLAADDTPAAAAPVAAPSRSQLKRRAKRARQVQRQEEIDQQLARDGDALFHQLQVSLAAVRARVADSFRLRERCCTSIQAPNSAVSAAFASALPTDAVNASALLPRLWLSLRPPCVLLDHAAQIRHSYTHHSLTGAGTFVRGGECTEACCRNKRDARSALSDAELHCSCNLFTLAQPFDASAGESLSRDPAPSAAVPSSPPSAPVIEPVLLRNPACVDAHVTHEGIRCIMPPHSQALISDLAHARELMLRPVFPASAAAGGFRLVVADPPWSCASVRRSGRYSTLAPERLLALPVRDMLSSSHACFVCVWVTHDPRVSTFVRSQLLPAWGVQAVATWTWLKVCDDGRPVRALHPTALTHFRKPYEQLIIGWRPAKSEENDAGAAAQLPDAFPRELTLVSVPGAKQHSRKPQLGELFAPYMSSLSACTCSRGSGPVDACPCGPVRGLELFARQLTAGWICWGNQCMLFQREHPAANASAHENSG